MLYKQKILKTKSVASLIKSCAYTQVNQWLMMEAKSRVALEVPQQNAAFFSVGDSRTSMLGLWSLGTAPLGFTLHVTFEVALDDFLEAPKHLKAQGITPLSFFGLETTEPSVIGWLPAAFISFRDPDGHLIGLPGGHSLVQLAYPN